MLKNKKGFTLVESIVTIAIFAIAGLILVTGFSTVIRYIGEGTRIKNITDSTLETLEKKEVSDTTSTVNAKITIKGGESIEGKVIWNEISENLEDDDSFKIKLHKFQRGDFFVDPTLSFYERVVKSKDEFRNGTKEEREKKYNDAVEELKKQGININYSFSGNLANNDSFRWFFYAVEQDGEFYPEIDRKFIEKANQIYDSINPGFPNSKMRYGDRVVYMKPYYMPTINKVILIGDTSGGTPSTWDQWRTSLIYNPDDHNWYYKVFVATNNSDPVESYFTVTVLTNATESQWAQLQADFKDASKWRKLEVGK